MSENAITIRRTAWHATWNGFGLGMVDETKPGLEMVLDEITRGTTGKHVLGHYFSGLKGNITVHAKDVNAVLIRTMMPWDTNATSTSITPSTPNADIYQYAQLLTLHPVDLAAATVTEDINLFKAVPFNCVDISRDGKKDEMWEIKFQIYPDRSQIAAFPSILAYGRYGATS